MGTEERERKKKQMRKLKKKKEKREEERYRRGGGRREEARSAAQRMHHPSPLPDAFPSQKQGNNMTPIKGRLGKNTTPTQRDPEKLIQRRQRNPIEDSRTSSIHLQ